MKNSNLLILEKAISNKSFILGELKGDEVAKFIKETSKNYYKGERRGGSFEDRFSNRKS